MTPGEYQEIIRNMPCHFCAEPRYGYVSWHHLLCLWLHGTALKAPDWGTIPVCNRCHKTRPKNGHNYGISREEQKAALMKTMAFISNEYMTRALCLKFIEKLRTLIDIDEAGEVKAWQSVGEWYWNHLP